MGTDFLSATTMAELGLTWLAQSSFLLAIGLIAGRACRRFGPAIQSAIYRTTLVATLLCPLASVLLTTAGVEGVSFRLASEPPSPAPVASPVSSSPESQLREESRPDPLMSRSPELLEERAPDSLAETPPPASPMMEIAEPAAARAIARFTLTDGLSAAFLLWLVGSMVLAIRLAVQQRRMRRLRTGAVLAGQAEQDLCGQVAGQMEVSTPHVWRSPYLFSPCLDGIRRPAILLPEDAGENLRDTFVHELAHLARRDGLWNLLRRVAAALFWFQPLLWVLSRRLETTAEEVCDDYVVQLGGDRALYASHLVELARRDLPPLSPAGVGMISLRSMLARRVVRILDTSRSLSTRAGRRAVVGTLAVGLVITTAAGLLGIGGRPPAAEAQVSEREAAEQMIEKSEGQIFGPDGKPFPGATVLVWSSEPLWPGINDFSDDRFDRVYTVKRTVTDKDGRYSLMLDKPESAKNLQFLATAPGHRPTVFHEMYLRKGFKVQLAEGDQPIEGQVIDLEGRPVPNVRVRIAQLYLQNADNPPTEDLRLLNGRNFVNGGEPLLPGGVTTDAEGRFQIKGLGRDTVALLKIFGQTIATKNVQVMTRDMATVPAPATESDSRGLNDPAMYGARCTITVEPTRPIVGVVRDKETNEPIPGAVVTALALSNSAMSIVGEVATTTDAEGRYRLVGLPKEGSSGHRLAVYPPVNRPYFVTSNLEPAPQPGFDPITFDIALRKGVWITGQVRKTTSSKPVAASVEYFPMLDNPIAADYSNFNPRIASIAISKRHKTDSDGRYRVPGLPGEGVVTVHTEDCEARVGVGSESIKKTEYGNLLTYNQILPSLYQVVKPVSIPRETRDFQCDLIVESGGSVKLRLVDPEGKPVNTAAVWGRYPKFVDHGDHNLYDESLVKISGLEPGKPRLVLIRDHSRKLGVILTVPGSRDVVDQERAVTLRPTATITGRLVDAQGKPASGDIRIEYQPPANLLLGNHYIDSIKLDSDGRFRSEVVPAGDHYHIAATDPNGYGFPRRMNENSFDQFVLGESIKAAEGQTVDLGTFDTGTGKRIEEPKPARTDEEKVSITGRIVDLEGQPVAGATVTVKGVGYSKGGDLADWLKAAQGSETLSMSSRFIDWDQKGSELKGREARTDADGRFQLPGFGKEWIVTLSLKGPSVAMAVFDVVTREVESFQASKDSNQYGPGTMTIHGINFVHTAVPSRPVEGVVRDAATKQPLVDVEVRSYRFAGSNFAGVMDLKQKTDANGHFRMERLPVGKGNMLLAVPNDEQPYFLHEFKLPDSSLDDSAPVEIELHRGIWIEGKLTEADTGKPISGARLHYLPFLANSFAEAIPEFGGGHVHGMTFQDRYLTRADGSFRLVGLPGRAIVGVETDHMNEPYLKGSGAEAIEGINKNGRFDTYNNPFMAGQLWPNVLREINPAAEETTFHVDLQAQRGASVKVRLVDREGNPVNGAGSGSRASRGMTDRGTTESEGLVMSLQPDEERTVYFVHKERKLGKAIRVRPGDDAKGPVVVTLEPLATIAGRITDNEGLPFQGAKVRPGLLPSVDFSPSLSSVSSGPDGRFVVENVPVGCDYSLAVENQGPITSRRSAFRKGITVKPGETTDVGDISFAIGTSNTSTGKRIEEPKPARADEENVSIAGRIVDLEGQPVAGATVRVERAEYPKDGDLSEWLHAARAAEQPGDLSVIFELRDDPDQEGREVRTDADGTFQLSGFGKEGIVSLSVRGGATAITEFKVVTRKIDSFQTLAEPMVYGSGNKMIHGLGFTHLTAPSRPVEGVVRDAVTKQPIEGVEVGSYRFAGSDYGVMLALKTRTDADGRFRIESLPMTKGTVLLAAPSEDQPYFLREHTLPDLLREDSSPIAIELHRGIWIEGVLTDAATGKPIPDAMVHYLPFLDNPFARGIPEFGEKSNVDGKFYKFRFVTKIDGTFRLLGLPGRAIVGAEMEQGNDAYLSGAGAEMIKGINPNGGFSTYLNPGNPGRSWPNVMVEINLADGAPTAHVPLQAQKGASVRIRVVDQSGLPISGVVTGGRTARGSYDPGMSSTDGQVTHLRVDEERVVYFIHQDRKLGKVIKVRPGDDAKGPLVVTLEPLASVTGRITDEDGIPYAEAVVRLDFLFSDKATRTLTTVSSASDGRFNLTDVPVGVEYVLKIQGKPSSANSQRSASHEQTAVKPGETTDVGDISFKE